MSVAGESVVVLLAEDDAAHAEIVRRNLTRFPVANRLVHVRDGQEALDYLRDSGRSVEPNNTRPHLILLDLRMPRVDGLGVLKAVKADPGLKTIPVVVLTTSNADNDRLKAYKTGANSYLVKPVNFDQFGRLMDALGHFWLEWNVYPSGT